MSKSSRSQFIKVQRSYGNAIFSSMPLSELKVKLLKISKYSYLQVFPKYCARFVWLLWRSFMLCCLVLDTVVVQHRLQRRVSNVVLATPTSAC